MVARALAMDGTCTGEHGVGLGKQKYLAAEHGPALEVMRAIKHTLDPDNRMNPGKGVGGKGVGSGLVLPYRPPHA
jgi:D-lactate dehydrogenase (cytochrome)